MRDMMIFGMMFLLIPMSFRSGYVAYLLWGWAGLASIQSYMYGFMLNFKFVQVFAIIALVQIILKKDKENNSFKVNRTSLLYIWFAFHILLCATFAYEGHPRRWELSTDMLKTILFCLLMPMVATSRFRIHAVVLIIAISTGYHGLIDGLKFIASGGGHLARGIQKFGDNNHFAMVLIMIIPLLVYCYRYSVNRLVRLGFLAVIPTIVFGVVATQSRGGFISLIVVALWFILKSRHKFSGLIVISFCAMIALQLAPDSWRSRMDTISEAGDDSSLMGRFGAWRVSSSIALSNPVFGGGPHAVEMGYVWQNFKNSPSLLGFIPNADMEGLPGRGRAAHSIYFEIMGDLGFVGFFIFLLILGNAFLTAREVIGMAKIVGPPLDWARDLAQMLSLAALAYIIGGSLLSAGYFELPYILFMLLEVVKQRAAELARKITTHKHRAIHA